MENLIREWKPIPRQANFLEIPDSVFEALYGGAAGGGKTETLLMLPLARKFHLSPRFKGIILRRTYPELEKEVIVRSHDFYSPTGAKYNDTKKRWTFPSGAIIQFGHCENEVDVKQYDSSEYNYAAFDELTSFSETQYVYISFSRVRSSDSSLPTIVRAGTNPGNIGHTWVFNRFVKPCETGYKIIRRKVEIVIKGVPEFRNIDSIFIPSLATDNDHLMAADPNYLTRLAALPPAERDAKLYGKWDAFEGQVFENFSEKNHVVEPFQIPYYWPRVLSVDWGFSAMMCAGLYAINPVPTEEHPAKIYKYNEYTCTKVGVSTWATNLYKMTKDDNIADVVLDPSAWQERGQGLIANLFAENFGRSARRAMNDRIGGKELLQEYFRTEPRPPRHVPREGYNQDVAMRILRMNGDKAFEEYKNLFIPEEPERFLPKFQIFNLCKETIRAIPQCVYIKDTKGKPNEDVQEFPGDDPYDETRYGIYACQDYLNSGQKEAVTATKIAEAEAQLQRSNDLTSYYMRMEDLERKENIQGIRRRRRF